MSQEHFHRENKELFCEQIPLTQLGRTYGTPLYVYSKAALLQTVNSFKQAFAPTSVQLCYSVKSNSNLSILSLMAGQGAGADIVSGGELFRALKAGIDPQKIVYSGVGKTSAEIAYALQSGIGMFNVESEPELNAISSIATQSGKIANIALRVNPDIDAGTHHYTTTAKKENKFGLPLEHAFDIYKRAASMPGTKPVGIDVHLGSPIYTLEPYHKALDILADFIIKLRAVGIDIRTLDMGGGFAIVYNNEKPFTPVDYAQLVLPYLKKLDCNLIIEPGRYIVGNSAVLVTSVTYVKTTPSKTFYICDAGMNDLIRPPLYDSYHAIVPAIIPDHPEKITVDIVGPICESSDFLGKQRAIERLNDNDMLAVMSAGAYGFSMSSNYNSRPRAAEVLVDGAQATIIRVRETYEDLVRGE